MVTFQHHRFQVWDVWGAQVLFQRLLAGRIHQPRHRKPQEPAKSWNTRPYTAKPPYCQIWGQLPPRRARNSLNTTQNHPWELLGLNITILLWFIRVLDPQIGQFRPDRANEKWCLFVILCFDLPFWQFWGVIVPAWKFGSFDGWGPFEKYFWEGSYAFWGRNRR